MAIAARVAAELKTDPRLHVATTSGSMGELTVVINGTDEVRASRFTYPRPSTVVRKVRTKLDQLKEQA